MRPGRVRRRPENRWDEAAGERVLLSWGTARRLLPLDPVRHNLLPRPKGEDSLLAYLESLCAALLARDAAAIRRHLRHPLARTLPRSVRDEALAIARLGERTLRAPVNTLRFYHQTTQLLMGSESRRVAAAESAEAASPDQLEFPLAANDE